MPTREGLIKDAALLSDEELVNRLRGGGLTDLAAEVARRELVARGINVERALSEAPQASSRAVPPAIAAAISAAGPILRRGWRFPLRAALGVEPLWAVVVFGGAVVFVLWKLIPWGITEFLYMRPDLPYRLPIAYAALGIFSLAVAWWGVALWRTGGRANALVWRILARIAAVLCAITAISGAVGGARLVQDEFSKQLGGVGAARPGR
jgi:hypothetical protein